MQDNRSKGIYSKQIVKCVDYIQANLQQELRLESIAEYLNMNPTYLYPLFKKELDRVHLRLHQDRAFENCGTSVAI